MYQNKKFHAIKQAKHLQLLIARLFTQAYDLKFHVAVPCLNPHIF